MVPVSIGCLTIPNSKIANDYKIFRMMKIQTEAKWRVCMNLRPIHNVIIASYII